MQFVCDEIRNRFCLGLDSLREDGLKYMDMLISDVRNKETTIEGLKEEILNLNSRLKESDIRYQETFSELEQTKTEYKKVMDVIENMKKTILHIAPVDVVQEQQEDEEWDEPSIKDIFLIIKHSLISNYFEIADRALLILSDSYIREGRVRDEDWQEVSTLLDEFIIRQQETGQSLTEGLMYLVKTADETECSPILMHILEKNGQSLEDIILRKAPAEKSMEEALVLLNTYFTHRKDSEIVRLLNKIMDPSIYPDNINVSIKQCLELLFVSMCCNMDDMTIEKAYVQNELEDSIPEIKCYNVYYDTINGTISNKQGIQEVESLKESLKIISTEIRDRTIEFIIKSLNSRINEDGRDNMEQDMDGQESEADKKDLEGNLLFYPRERSGKNEAVLAISFIKKGRRECTLCGSDLSSRNAGLAFYSGKSKIAGYTECELLYCEKCGGYFADQPMVDSIIPEVRPHKIRLARPQSQENGEQDMAAF